MTFDRALVVSDGNQYHASKHIAPILGSGFSLASVMRVDPLLYDDLYMFGFWGTDQRQLDIYRDRFEQFERVIVQWVGSDRLWFMRLPPVEKAEALEMLRSPHVVHCVPCEEMVASVAQILRVNVATVHTPTIHLYEDISPLPEEFAVSVYYPDTPESAHVYGLDCVDAVIDSMPETSFFLHYIGNVGTPDIAKRPNVTWCGMVPEEEYEDFLRQVTVMLRLTSHDGTPYTMMDHQCAGRYCITQQKFPFCIQTERDVEQVTATINMIRSQKQPNFAGASHWRSYSDHAKFREAIGNLFNECQKRTMSAAIIGDV